LNTSKKTTTLVLPVNLRMENLANSVKSVLIIDDETDFCLLMKNYFVRKNFDVYIYHTLEEGMKNIEKINPDIIFLDNNLPDGLGWEKTEYIRQHFPNTRINLISAYQYDHSISEKLTSVRIWEKPISLIDLNKYLN
jgi:two-component system, OmpR family, response regulator